MKIQSRKIFAIIFSTQKLFKWTGDKNKHRIYQFDNELNYTFLSYIHSQMLENIPWWWIDLMVLKQSIIFCFTAKFLFRNCLRFTLMKRLDETQFTSFNYFQFYGDLYFYSRMNKIKINHYDEPHKSKVFFFFLFCFTTEGGRNWKIAQKRNFYFKVVHFFFV